mmetsp:Transcript_40248/g.45795  ORF Transcript_40248/g.45795 Transcript_40248/m.45795 type:complete len:477 (-) Transcript_40248:111-1541(-)|eukprot:CAMPEP_0194131294 /NCGR_PEP_ID=MMETSP0152-20130528/2097_1 /TAXON_ID=1049557 /ORGANISM="Thalassiothrix antarctica, Strain L6-D1" /LENGTH=476 /DNA_ID=CAMNT_0038826039 /DNA_START=31 /DNA_END=1461 /DNA_ORIENTATION=+
MENDNAVLTSPGDNGRNSNRGYLRVSREMDGSEMMEENDLTEGLLNQPDQHVDEPLPSHPVSRASHWIKKMGHFLGYITLLSMLIVVPMTLYSALQKQRFDLAAYHSAEVMVIGTIVLSVRLVYLHLTHWYMPDVQKYVVRILWMVPIYSFQSWLSLRFIHARIYIDAIRDIYEAFVIASFVYYLIELLGGENALVRLLERKNDPSLGSHGYLLELVMKPWKLGTEFMLQCKHGVLQYVVIKTIAAILTFIFQWMHIYGEGEFNATVAYPYMAFILNVSVMYALYALVKLFHAVRDELCSPINWKPLGKFLCIKGVVFFTWWQGVLIFYLRAHGVIEDVADWTSSDVANGLIDYCICIEMVFFAIAHSFSFTYKEYLPARFENDALVDGQTTLPRTLERPMRLRDALWSSTIPEETLADIQRMRHTMIDNMIDKTSNQGSISLSEVAGGNETNTDSPLSQNEDQVTLSYEKQNIIF